MPPRKDSGSADMIIVLMGNEDGGNGLDGLANLVQGFLYALAADSGVYKDGSITG